MNHRSSNSGRLVEKPDGLFAWIFYHAPGYADLKISEVKYCS
jgi:hypothetical protein